MAFTRLKNLVTHFRVEGRNEAPPIVFINSLGTDFRIWDGVAATFTEHMRVILYDKRGHGLSDANPATNGIDDYADDLLALLDHLAVNRVSLIGLYIGGMIAQRLATRAPERVDALILCDTAAKIGTPDMWAARIDAVEKHGIEPIADAILERWFTKHFRHEKTDELAGWRNMLIRTSAPAYTGACAAIRDADLRAQTATIKAPTLCLVGDEDGATPPDLVRETAAMIPGAKFSIIPNSGHLPCIEQPALLTELILTHLQETNSV